MTPLQTSTGVLPGTDRDGRRSGVFHAPTRKGVLERRVLHADWEGRLLGAPSGGQESPLLHSTG